MTKYSINVQGINKKMKNSICMFYQFQENFRKQLESADLIKDYLITGGIINGRNN